MNGTSTLEGFKPGWPVTAPEFRCPAAPSRGAILLALFTVGFVTFLNLYATQPLLPQFRKLFHASELAVSLTVSAPVLAVAIAGPVLGTLADALGRKRVIVTAMMALSLPTALAATSTTLGQFIGWRFLQGFFTPGIVAVVMAYISEETQNKWLGSTMATYVTGTVVGGFAGRFTAGLLAAHWNWRVAMATLGLCTFAGALLTWRLLPRSQHFRRHADFRDSAASALQHLRNPQLLATFWVGFNVLFCLVGSFTYVNFYLADAPFHLGPAALASIFGVYLIGAAITPLAGKIIDRAGCRVVVMGASMTAAGGILLTLVQSTPAVVAGLALAASGAFACQSAASLNVGRAAGKARSSASGLYLGFYYAGGCCGSVLPGLFWKQSGWFGCVAIIVCVQVLIALITRKLWKADAPARKQL